MNHKTTVQAISAGWRRAAFLVLVLAALMSWTVKPAAASEDGRGTRKVFLPVAYNDSRGGSAAGSGVMLGVYPENWWAPTPEEVVNKLHDLDTWAGKGTSLAGVFHSLDTASEGNIVRLFSVIWNDGYTPFVNLHSGHSARDIAGGRMDGQIRAWARYYLQYTNNGARTAFLAPLQEMNGEWVPYGGDPVNFKIAFRRIVDIFHQEGVSDSSVIWVFAPNGYSSRGMPDFESYYPGADYAEVVAISAYNFGCHPSNDYAGWTTPQEVFGPYLPRLRAMAPGSPIFIAQTGTTAYGCGQGTKDSWLEEAYNYLASEQDVKGVLYYNANIEYDWAFYLPGRVAAEGYRRGVDSPAYVYIPPRTMQATFR